MKLSNVLVMLICGSTTFTFLSNDIYCSTEVVPKRKTDAIQAPVYMNSEDDAVQFFVKGEQKEFRMMSKEDSLYNDDRQDEEDLNFNLEQYVIYKGGLPDAKFSEFSRPKVLNMEVFMMLSSKWSQSRMLRTIVGTAGILSQCGIYLGDLNINFITNNLENANLSKRDLNFVAYMARDRVGENDTVRVAFTNIAKISYYLSDYLRGGSAYPERYVNERPAFSIGFDEMISPQEGREMRVYEFIPNFVYMGHEGANHRILAHELGHILRNDGATWPHSEDKDNLMHPIVYGTSLSQNQCNQMRTEMPHLFR